MRRSRSPPITILYAATSTRYLHRSDTTSEKRPPKPNDGNFGVREHTLVNLACIVLALLRVIPNFFKRFTSGRAGNLEDVMLEHCSVSDLVLDLLGLVGNSHPYRYRRSAQVLSSFTYVFDPFAVYVFGVLPCGTTLVTEHKEPVLGDSGGVVKNLCINVVHYIPSILSVVLPEHQLWRLLSVLVKLGKELTEDCVYPQFLHHRRTYLLYRRRCHVLYQWEYYLLWLGPSVMSPPS